MKKSQKIVISRVENGFLIDVKETIPREEHTYYVYNLYGDLIRDMNAFFRKAKEEEVEEEEIKNICEDDEDDQW